MRKDVQEMVDLPPWYDSMFPLLLVMYQRLSVVHHPETLHLCCRPAKVALHLV